MVITLNIPLIASGVIHIESLRDFQPIIRVHSQPKKQGIAFQLALYEKLSQKVMYKNQMMLFSH